MFGAESGQTVEYTASLSKRIVNYLFIGDIKDLPNFSVSSMTFSTNSKLSTN